jgi:uncharacterized DUF497 family protein
MEMLRFEWDPQKAARNLHKHGISFEIASHVFDDPFVLSYIEGIEHCEERWQTIGCVEGFLLVLVVHTIREEDEDGAAIEVIRIISAREADRKERKRYEEETR